MSDLLSFLMSYETLRVIWWLFLGVLLIGFAIMDGFDLGVGALLPFVAKNDDERRVLLNTVGPTWEGNQVWFILGGGAIFAAFPLIYSAAFSGFFVALILVLFALILRPVGFDYRSKLPDPRWRALWDWCLFIGGFVPALVFGVAFGNLLQGVPFRYDDSLRVYYEGSFFGLLNPFGLLVGVVSLSMLVMHGAVFLQLKTVGELRERARRWHGLAALVFAASFVLAGIWLAFGIAGHRLVSFGGTAAASNPLAKQDVVEAGAWFANFRAVPLLWLIPALALAAAAAAWRLAPRRPGLAFVASGTAVAGTILTAAVAMFPFMMPSSLAPSHGLTLWDATSSLLTLRWMFWMTVLFLPLIVLYT
ncbi:MAG TPA: cytochrome d ubiquinol oxidase subunit II, partial [Tahibacter sp.]|nr:cytochrome d ubiquinol oxidase subunit II [Tahibacter sp.]